MAVAEAARLEGDHTTAIDAARRAETWFASRQSFGWERAAALEATRSQHECRGLDSSDIDCLEAMADAAAVAGDVRGELAARSLAAVAACECGQVDRGDQQGRLVASVARRAQVLQARLVSHHAVASVRLARGDLAGARRQLRKALDALESTRQLCGAGDAGVAVATQARSITHLAFRLATLERQPMRALAWMEQARIAGWVSRPALPPTDIAVAADFARLRSVAGDLRRAELAGQPTGELRRRQATLEQAMRAEWLKEERPGQGKVQPARLNELEAVVGDGQVVSIACTNDRLVAVVVDRRRATLCTLGDPADVLRNAERATTALRGMSASGSAAVLATRHRLFSAAVEALDTALLRPCRLEGSNIVLVVPAELLALPWAALPSLQDRPFTLAPTVTWWIDAALRPAAPTRSALVVAGPRLQEADGRSAGVAACHRRATVLAGAEATVENVSAAMADHDVAHVVAHGRFRHDNPLWSTIELDDGDLTVYELERRGQVPPTVVLATCESGVGGVRGGAQLHGLAGTLLTMGARTIVAAIGALPDTIETRDTMVGLHRDLVNGASASSSLARRRAGTDGVPSPTAAGLVTLGVG